MYKCWDCGEVFDEPPTHEEYHPEVHASEYWWVCPHCGSEDIDEVDDDEEDYEE